MAFALLKPLILNWLNERAFKLPEAQLRSLAAKAGVSLSEAHLFEQTYRENAVAQIDRILK